MARVRSPNYPQFSLAEAIRRVGTIFDKDRQHPLDKQVLAKHLGYGSLNGASLGAISAVVKYGLVDQDGDVYRVSNRAVTILHPHTEAEKRAAIAEAAYAPALFAELREHFKGPNLPTDDTLRAYLVRRGFANSALTSVIQSFRETMELVTPSTDGVETKPQSEEVQMQAVQREQAQQRQSPAPPPPTESTLRVAVNDDRLDVTAALMDRQSVDRLIRVLQANKELLPEKKAEQKEDLLGDAPQ